MRIIATVPNPGYTPEYIIQISACDIAALAGMTQGSVIAKRKGQDYSIATDKLMPGDEISSKEVFRFRDRVLNISENGDEIKKAISFARGALTKLEKIVAEESEAAQ